jgi:hypothetical protein
MKIFGRKKQSEHEVTTLSSPTLPSLPFDELRAQLESNSLSGPEGAEDVLLASTALDALQNNDLVGFQLMHGFIQQVAKSNGSYEGATIDN